MTTQTAPTGLSRAHVAYLLEDVVTANSQRAYDQARDRLRAYLHSYGATADAVALLAELGCYH